MTRIGNERSGALITIEVVLSPLRSGLLTHLCSLSSEVLGAFSMQRRVPSS